MNDLSRRDFLKITCATASGFCVGNFLESKISNMMEKYLGNENKSDYDNILERSFKPLQYETLGENANFCIFMEIIEYIGDDAIIFKTGTKLGFKNNIITIPPDIKNKDIPKLLNIITENSTLQIWNEKIRTIRESYLNITKALLIKRENTKLKQIYSDAALKSFAIYSVYNGKKEREVIEKNFNGFLSSEIQKDEDINILVNTFDSLEKEFAEISNNDYKFDSEEKKSFMVAAKNNIEVLFLILKKIITKAISSNYNIKNKDKELDFIINILITTYKTEEILCKRYNDPSNSSIIASKTLKKAEELLSSKAEKTDDTYEKHLDTYIQNEIKRNLEEILFRLMTENLNGLFEKAKINIDRRFQDLDIKELQSDYFYSYIDNEFSIEERKEMFKGKNKPGILPLIEKLPAKNKEIVIKRITEIETIFYSSRFKEKFSHIKEDRYKLALYDIKDNTTENQLLTMFIIYNAVSSGINNVLHSEYKMHGNYDSESFQIRNMKGKKYKLNCMSASILSNILSERLFGMTSKGVIFLKHKGEFASHMANAFEIDGNYLIFDSTFNQVFIKEKGVFDNMNTYDVDSIENTYMSASYYNIGSLGFEKYLDSWTYNLYVNLTGKKKFEYISDLIKTDNLKPYLGAKSTKIEIKE